MKHRNSFRAAQVARTRGEYLPGWHAVDYCWFSPVDTLGKSRPADRLDAARYRGENWRDRQWIRDYGASR